jgi:AraC-like DNA-binding protein
MTQEGSKQMPGEIRFEQWATSATPPTSQYEAWFDKLNRTFGTWRSEGASLGAFQADLRQTSMPDMSLVECRCEPCAGYRSKSDASDSETEDLTIQLVVSGREFMKLGEQQAILSQGDIFIWDSTQSMSFEVIQPLHKISLVVPLQRLKDWLPGRWKSLPRKMNQSDPGTAILSSFLQELARVDYQATPLRQAALTEAAVAMLVAPMSDQDISFVGKLAQLDIVKSKIMKQLRDPTIDLGAIAKSNRISLRYLHQLFESEGCTPWRFVTRERMSGCYRDLVNPVLQQRSITDIAFSWGFSSVTHFSRKIKAEYGSSPSKLRAAALRR